MPVMVKIGGYYTMPVKRIGSEELRPVMKTSFGLPTFKKTAGLPGLPIT